MSGFDRILEMVSKVNVPTYPLTSANVVLEDMIVENATTHNTRITMRSRGEGLKYSGMVNLFYTRVQMASLAPLEFAQTQQFDLPGVLTLINAEKQSQLALDDVTNVTVPVLEPNTPTKFVLSARDSSLVWLGNVEVTLTLTSAN